MSFIKQLMDFLMIDISTFILYLFTFVLLLTSLIKSKEKTFIALKKGWKSFVKIVFILIPLFTFVGIILTLVTPDIIQNILGGETGIFGIIYGVLIGSIAFMPPFVAYPLGFELLNQGAGYAQIAAFVAALMAVGFVYLPVEIKYFGKKATIFRNTLGIIASILVAIVMMGVM